LNSKIHLAINVFTQLREPIEGLEEWLDAVSRVHIPCAVVSCLDRINMVGALERMGLKKYFQVCNLL
jgi:beta-phosphoglucomutase-like phosphatase (HAD superfamily)